MTAEQLMALGRNEFEAVVMAEMRDKAEEGVVEALASTLVTAERWQGSLRRALHRSERALSNPGVCRSKGEDWVERTEGFCGYVRDRLTEVDPLVDELRRTHEHTDLTEIVGEAFRVIDSCEGDHDLELTGRQWRIVDRVIS